MAPVWAARPHSTSRCGAGTLGWGQPFLKPSMSLAEETCFWWLNHSGGELRIRVSHRGLSRLFTNTIKGSLEIRAEARCQRRAGREENRSTSLAE